MAPEAMAAKKYVLDYQVSDEHGSAIGKPTHLEADTPEEMFEKQKQAHVAATRALQRQNEALARLRSGNLTPKAPERKFETKPISADEAVQLGIEAQNPTSFVKAVEKVIDSRVPVKDITDESQEQRAARIRQERKDAAIAFVLANPDYYRCQANEKVISDYLDANGLAWTTENLNVAYAACLDRLAEKPAKVSSNQPEEPAAAPSNEPAVTSNPVTPAAKRPASSGIMPGQFTANRPVKQGMTKAEAVRLARTNPTEYKRMMRDPRQAKILEAALKS